MTAASSFRPGRRRPRPGSAGFPRTALAPLALAAFGFALLSAPAPAAAQTPTFYLHGDIFDSQLEGASGTTKTVTLELRLAPASTATTTVDYTFTEFGGEARLGVDITGPATGTLTFPPGETSQTVEYVIIGDDGFRGGDRSFLISMSNPTGGASIDSRAQRQGLIVEDELPPLEIDSPRAVEGGQGSTTTLSFTVSFGTENYVYKPAGEFKYRLAADGGRATPDDDYAAVTGATLRKPEMSSTVFTWTIDVTVNGDDTPEPDETVRIELYDAVFDTNRTVRDLGGATSVRLANVIGTGTIVNDDLPAFSIDSSPSPSVAEGATGTTAMLTFTVTAAEMLMFPAELPWRVTGGTATAGEDLGALSGTVAFAANSDTATFGVPVVGDETHERDETVEVEVTPPGGTAATGTGTIRNDDPLPRITFDSPSVEEGEGPMGETNLKFTATMDRPSYEDVKFTLEFATPSSTATDGTDFDSFASGVDRTIAAGSTTRSFTVVVNDDDEVEENETVDLHIISVENARLATSTFAVAPPDDMHLPEDERLEPGTRLLARGTIIDDEPRVSIQPRSVQEGDSGDTTNVRMRFTLDRAHDSDVSVKYRLATFHPGTTASATTLAVGNAGDNDLRWASSGDERIVTFMANSTEAASEMLTVIGDDRSEPDETVVFEITSVPAGIGIRGASSAALTILDDDLPRLSIDSPEVVEGGAGSTTDLVFTVSLSATTASAVTADWEVVARGTTADPGDYTLPGGREVRIPAGSATTTITVQVNGDMDVERDETVTIRLSSPMPTGDVVLGTAEGTGTIRDDDVPVVSIAAPAAVTERGAGTTTMMTFPITLDRPSYQEVTVTWGVSSASGTATSGTDFQSTGGTLTVASGTTMTSAVVTVLGDAIDEDDETVVVELLLASEAMVSPTAFEAAGTITDDDDPSEVSITGASTVERGQGETATLSFTIALDRPSGKEVTVEFVEVGGTAQARGIGDPLEAGDDFESRYTPGAVGRHTFRPGEVSHVVDYVVHGDDRVEEDEEVRLELVTADNVDVGNISGTGVIVNDDFAEITVADVGIKEGDAGRSKLSFTLSMSLVSDLDVEIGAEVRASSTAVSEDDFRPPASGVTIAAGTTSATFVVEVEGEGELEPDETVVVLFEVEEPVAPPPPGRALVSFGSGALTAEATGTIRNDDKLTVEFVGPLTRTVTEGYAGATTTETFMVQLSGVSSGTTTVEVAYEGSMSFAVIRDVARTVLNPDLATATDEIVFPAGVRKMPFEVYVLDDGEDEPDEDAVFSLLDPSTGVSVATGGGRITVTIRDDDVPELAVDSPGDVSEGDDGDATAIRFTVTLEPAAHQDVTVAYAYGGTADGNDFTSAPVDGTLTFTAGQTSKTLDLEVSGDRNPEPNETVTVTLSNPMPPGAATVGTSTGEARIVNDDDATLTIGSPSVTEGADGPTTPLVFEVELSPRVNNEVTVDWSVVQASSTQMGVTYPDGESGMLVFPPNTADPQTITVEVTDNDNHEPDRFVVIELSSATGGAVVLDPLGRGTIVDDDDPVLSVADARVVEGASGTTTALGFALTLDREPHGAVTVDWQVTGTPTTEPDDWVGGAQPVGGTVTFAAGETATSAVVGTVRGDNVGEGDEEVMVRFSNPTGDAMFAGGALEANVTGTIENDDFPEITVVSAPDPVAEGAMGSATSLVFTVTLAPVSDREVTVSWGGSGESGSGIAEEGVDYTFDVPAGSGRTLRFAPGESSKTIGVTVNGDDTSEPNERVTIVLGSLTGNARFPGGAPRLEATGTIRNDDSITLSVVAPGDVDEGAAGTRQTLDFTVELSSAPARTVTARYAVGGTAGTDDFATRPSGRTLTFGPTKTSETLSFEVQGDGTAERDETVSVALVDGSLTGAVNDDVTLDPTPGEVTIRNDDVPQLTLAGPAAVDEGDDDTTDLVFRLSLDIADYEDVVVDYALGGTATMADMDYGTPVPASQVTIRRDAREGTVRVPVRGDMLVEPDETVTLRLTGISAGGAAEFAGGAASLDATATIRNDDVPMFSIDSPRVKEGDVGDMPTLTFTVSLLPAATGAASVMYRDSGAGSATSGDYIWPGDGTLNFPVGATSMPINVTIIGDVLPEPNQTIEVELFGATGAGIAPGRGTGTGTIQEDDLPLVSIDSPEVFEGDGGTTDLTFTVSMSVASSNPVTVDWEVAASSTADSSDYRLGGSGRRTIGAGATSTTLVVPVVGDVEDEPDETLVIVIDTGDQRVILGDREGVGTIVNDDIGLSIAGPAAPVVERDTGATPAAELAFTVTLAGTSTRDVTVKYAVAGGGGDPAESGDYGTPAPPRLLVIPAGSTSTTLTVPVTGDDEIENDETVRVTLSDPVGTGLGTRVAEGVILNDDVPGLRVATSSVPEGGRGERTPLPFEVNPLQPVPSGVTVTYRYAGDLGSSDADGRDFDFAIGTFEIVGDGTTSTRVTVDVFVFGDIEDESDETVTVRFLNPVDDADVVGTGTGTIRNDDAKIPDLTVAAVPSSVPEGGVGGTSTLTFTLTLSATTSADVMVSHRALDDGTAESGEDYAPAPASPLVIEAGSTSTELVVRIVGDGEAEPDETVAFLFSVVGNTARIASGSVRVEATIENDDALVLSVDSPSVDEGTGVASTTLEFRVSRSGGDLSASTTFAYELGGTATPGADYAATSTGSLVIAPGAASTTIEVAVRADSVEEDDETVTLTLSSDEAGVMGGPGVGTIHDDDGAKLSIDSPMVEEGATTTLTFTVTLSQPTSAQVTFRYQVAADKGTARVGVDYDRSFAPSGTITIPAGATSVPIRVPIIDDDYGEPNDDLVIRISEATGARIRTDMDEGTGTIMNDAADETAVSVTGAETEAGEAVFTVEVHPAAAEPVLAFYRLEGGTAEVVTSITKQDGTPGDDYVEIPAGGLGEVRARPTAGTVRFTVTAARGATQAYEVHASENARELQVAGDGDRVARAKALGYVLAGIGRTVATNIVDLVWDRAENHRSGVGGSHATVGGRRIDTAAFADEGDGALLRAAVGLAGDLLGVDTAPEALLRDAERRLARGEGLGALRDWTDIPSARDLAGRTDFALSFANGEGLAPYTFWGRGSFTAFESGGLDGGGLGDFSSDGEVFAGHLGLDYRFREDLLAGVAVSRTMGDVDYGFAGDGGSRGGVETELTSLHPYLHGMSPDGLGVWATLGYGTGSAELDDGDGTVETDLSMEMLAFGVRDELAYLADMDLAVKGDAFMAGISADEVAGSIDAVDSDVFRVRLALEGSSEQVVSDGGVFAGRFELGARLDGGDAEEGFGADLAAGFDYVLPDLGIEVRGRGSLLLVHEESDFREWGLGLGLLWDPGVAGRGLRLSVEPTWNAPSAGGAAAMWDAGPGGGGGTTASARGASLDARLGYGMGVLGDRALATVFGELGRADGDARLRLGAGLGRPDAGGRGLGLELYGERRDRAAGPDHSLVLKGRLGF